MARGVVRNPEHVAELERLGTQAIVLDLERDELTGAVRGADAVVFAAGAGAGSGPERKQTVDLGGAVMLIDACRAEGVARYLMISATGAADPSAGPEAMRPYLEAKAEADRRLAGSGLDFTIVRPGRLTDEPGTGRIDAAPSLGRRGEVTRDDVAQTSSRCWRHRTPSARPSRCSGGRRRSPRRSPRSERVTASPNRDLARTQRPSGLPRFRRRNPTKLRAKPMATAAKPMPMRDTSRRAPV